MEVITIKQDNALKRPSQILKHDYVCSVFVRLSERLRKRSGTVSASHLVESEGINERPFFLLYLFVHGDVSCVS